MIRFSIYSLLWLLFFTNLATLDWCLREQEHLENMAERIYYHGCILKGAPFDPPTGIVEECTMRAKSYGRIWKEEVIK